MRGAYDSLMSFPETSFETDRSSHFAGKGAGLKFKMCGSLDKDLTLRLSGFKILNNATLIFQNGLFLGILLISFII